MPEGDTIHRAARRMNDALAGRVPERVLSPSPRVRAERLPERLAGRAVVLVEAHGKHIFLRLEGDLTLHSHLRMTGAWGVHAAGERWKRARSRAWLVLGTEDRDVVQFDGPVLRLMSDGRLRADPQIAGLGQDVIGESFDFELFLARLREGDPTRPIGDVLLDQRTVAGIGNVWKAETCFAVGVDPWRRLDAVDDEEAVALIAFARERMRESALGDGFSARPRAIYGRGGRPCTRCGTTVLARGQWDDNRMTFWCPGCQR